MYTVQVLASDKTIHKGTIEDVRKRDMTWLDYSRPTKEEIEELAKLTEISATDIEESLQSSQRPELRDTAHYSMITLRFPVLRKAEAATKPIVILVSKERKDFITIHRDDSQSIKRMQAYSEQKRAILFEQGATELLFALIAEMVTSYYIILNDIEARISKLESVIFKTDNNTDSMLMQDIFRTKKTLIYFYQSLTGNREILSSIEQAFATFLDTKKLPRFRLLASDLTQLIELVATERDILSTTLEVHLSAISNSLNETVKKVTSWGALILVPSLIASIYGMNFQHLPGTDQIWGFPLLIVVMIASVALLFKYFRTKDWI